MSSNLTIGFIGIGVMGHSMARHLQEAGYPLHVHTRTRRKALQLIDAGAVWHDAPGDLAAAVDVLITMVGYPHDVESLYLGDRGLVTCAERGSLLIDMTTSSPSLAVRIADRADARGVRTLDAPVSGGDIGAREARLSIMVGGREDAFEDARTILEYMGHNVVHQGPSGAGQHTKMCNQIAIASGMLGICEALIYAERSGLKPATVLESIRSGAAGSWSLSNLAPRIIEGDFTPGFYVKHFVKDLQIALESAATLGLELPGLSLAKRLYDQLAQSGREDEGTQALFRLYAGH